MSFIQYVPNNDQWSRYFVAQASNNITDNKKKGKELNSIIGGSISSKNDKILSVVGRVKANNFENEKNQEIKVNMTSPAEATADQAASELENISEQHPDSQAIARSGTKRKPSLNSKKKQVNHRAKVRRYYDIFSK
jgi:hypothetical protein